MKILHILGELKPSGAEVMLRSAAPYWKSRFSSLDILCTGNDLGVYATQLRNAGYSVHHIPFRKQFSFFSELARLLSRESYDLVHIHTERANFYYAVIAKVLGVSTILRTIHSKFAFTGWLGFRSKWQRWMLRQLGINHISISSSVQKTERQYLGNATTVIPNWYDESTFRPPTDSERSMARSRIGAEADTEVLITTGNCSTVKNHQALITALSKSQQKNFLYLHIGLEENESEKCLAQQRGISDKVIFLGYQHHPCDFLWAADIFVMPSLYEGFGVAAVEALATGIPVVFTRVPGLLDFGEHVPGIQWAEPTEQGLLHAIEGLRQKPYEERFTACRQAAEAAKQRRGTRLRAERYLRCYFDKLYSEN